MVNRKTALHSMGFDVDYICALGTNGKLTSNEAYLEIKQLWKKLKKSKKELAIGTSDAPPEVF
ncbi:DUF7219 family protein [Leptothoe spongobia]|uniref:Uncharacterized protein n=1 Tax=Leptothoe spongobia TAU-MAC 1115 TaxID=1967444 RepID=A0A947DHE2_9CYAN|nr:hypothetical protein [Leptothoe spongobia]MBT9316951.1 hypothetical protein [Leptothoe spongobia TAU-MAC 1115]